jgi:hypothetical protein
MILMVIADFLKQSTDGLKVGLVEERLLVFRLKAKVEVQAIGRGQINIDFLFHKGERTSTRVMAQG